MKTSHALPSYLKMHRKRVGLSQQEIAFLLGCRFGAKVSLYERFRREPNLKTALAYEVIFHAPASKLFAGIYEQVEHNAVKRARMLARRLGRQHASGRKVAILKAISEHSPEDLRYEPTSHQ